jgi:hypothetical protein
MMVEETRRQSSLQAYERMHRPQGFWGMSEPCKPEGDDGIRVVEDQTGPSPHVMCGIRVPTTCDLVFVFMSVSDVDAFKANSSDLDLTCSACPHEVSSQK